MDNQNLIDPAPTALDKRPAKAADPLEELTPKQRLFITLLIEGKKPQDAYVKAGYEGDPSHAAYVLKSRLDKQITLMAMARGTTKADLITQMQALHELPVVDNEGKPVTGISMQHKLRLIAMQNTILSGLQDSGSDILGIQINFGTETPVKPVAVEAQVIRREGETYDNGSGAL